MKLNKQVLSMSRTLYVPTARAYEKRTTWIRKAYTEQFDDLLRALAEVCGGVTLTSGKGVWLSKHQNVTEDVELVKVAFHSQHQRRQVSAIMDSYTRHLLDLGEEAVLREWHRKGDAGFVLYTAEWTFDDELDPL